MHIRRCRATLLMTPKISSAEERFVFCAKLSVERIPPALQEWFGRLSKIRITREAAKGFLSKYERGGVRIVALF